jgi:polyisoprenoid-binding protein YceI
MKKLFLLAAFGSLFGQQASAQALVTKTGHITFFSSSPMENIEAHNYKVKSGFDSKTGELTFEMLIKGFQFEKALMQQHFNEAEYMDSGKFPKSSFKGKVEDLSKVNFAKDGAYPVSVSGDMLIKGVTKPVKANGTLTVKGGKISAKSEFTISLKEYGVSGSAVKAGTVSDKIKITVDVKEFGGK